MTWILIALGGIGLAGAYIPPTASWIVAVLAILVPPIVVLLLPTLFFTGLTGRWIPLGLALTFILVVVFRHVSPDRWERPAPGTGDLVR